MGYTKIVQMAHQTIVTEYQKPVREHRHTPKRHKKGLNPVRSSRSIKRARLQFFRLVEHNLASRDELPWFLTLTYHDQYQELPDIETAYRHLGAFFARLKTSVAQDFAYLSVPEWQKRGAIHFHALVWGLPESTRKERSTRFLQRCWQQGYCDVRRALYKSPKLAGYLAKYLSKAKADQRLGNRKAYTASRNIERPREKGSNSMSSFISTLVDETELTKISQYETMWLGRAEIRIYTHKNYAENRKPSS